MSECFYHPDDMKKLRKLRELQPELFKSFVEFDSKVFEAGTLGVKVKELIAVGIAHITQCPYCIDAHTKRAKKAGATEVEIAEAIFVAMALRAGGSWAHSAIAMRALEE
ncbi:MAG TPA: carboxymuconolactone decarboxylase family protein [Candidatus Acidoferrales bacterium]|nr:carboxymuconolactone decarboxylase family protein [Candidatus Acidoferrales bacterium]